MTNQPTRKRDALRVLAAVAAVLLAVSAGAGAVAAVPSPPHEVFGTVTDQNGDPVADVTVSVTDEDGNTVTTTTNADGYYEIKYPAENADDGETLTVSVDGESWTTSFSSGASEEHDFQVTVETSTPSPPDSPDETPSGDEPVTSDPDDGGGGGGQPAAGGGGQPADSTTEVTDSTTESTPDSTADGTESTPDSTTESTPDSTADGTESTPDSTADATETTPDSTTEQSNESGSGIPGFGAGIAVVAVVAAALLALRTE